MGGFFLFISMYLGGLWWARHFDRRWYRAHPGAETKFGEIDFQLTKQGQ